MSALWLALLLRAGLPADELDRSIRDVLAAKPIAGLSVGVYFQGSEWKAAYGDARLLPKIPATSETTYRLGSVTKTFTAMAVMQLVEEGRIDLDAEVQRYVPTFPKKPWPLTVRQLLSHLGGIYHYRDQAKESHLKTHHSTAQALAIFRDWPLASEPGTHFLYTSYGYNLLGAVVEGAAGQSYGGYLAQHVFTPLGMTRSGLEDRAALGEQDAWGYRWHDGKLTQSEQVDISSRFGGGGLRSNVDDLLKDARGLFDHAVLKPETWAQMVTPAVTRTGHAVDYGYGFAVYPQRGHFVAAHLGGQPETTTLLFLLPAEQLAVVLLCNVEGQGALLSDLAVAVSEVLLEEGRPRRGIYASAPADAVVGEAMSKIFSYGLARHSGMAAPRGSTSLERDAAFAAMSKLLTDEPEKAKKELADAHHPLRGAYLPRVGLEMAQLLASEVGPARMRRYPALGPAAFFADWFELCSEKSCPHFSAEAETRLKRVVAAMAPGSAEEIATLRLDRVEKERDLERLLAGMGSQLHPDFSRELAAVGLKWVREGKTGDGLSALSLGVRLHPTSVEAQLALIEGLVMNDDDRQPDMLLHGLPKVTKDSLLKRAAQAAPAAARWFKEKASKLGGKGEKETQTPQGPAP